jgi:hypothetical protein
MEKEELEQSKIESQLSFVSSELLHEVPEFKLGRQKLFELK